MNTDQATRAAFDYLSARNPWSGGLSQADYFERLTNYAATYGNEALQALAGFHLYTSQHLSAATREKCLAAGMDAQLNGTGPQAGTGALRATFVKYWHDYLAQQAGRPVMPANAQAPTGQALHLYGHTIN